MKHSLQEGKCAGIAVQLRSAGERGDGDCGNQGTQLQLRKGLSRQRGDGGRRKRRRGRGQKEARRKEAGELRGGRYCENSEGMREYYGGLL
jgi:hypothetical protein